VNSVAIHQGLAALAVEAHSASPVCPSCDRRAPGKVLLYDTSTREPASGVNEFGVGSLPDMLTFTHDRTKLLVANEGTPNVAADMPYAAIDPPGSVSIIDVEARTVVTTAFLSGVPTSGANLRLPVSTGMDFEPEYIAVNHDDTLAFDMPDAIASYKWRGQTYLVMANEGDFREDNADRSAASTFGAVSPLDRLRVSNRDCPPATCSRLVRGRSPFAARTGPWFSTAAASWTARRSPARSTTTAAAATRASNPKASPFSRSAIAPTRSSGWRERRQPQWPSSTSQTRGTSSSST
jgi:hypothetical protein